MTRDDEKRLLGRLAGDKAMIEWLSDMRAMEIEFLLGAPDPMKIYRAQGRVQMLDKLIDVLEHHKVLR